MKDYVSEVLSKICMKSWIEMRRTCQLGSTANAAWIRSNRNQRVLFWLQLLSPFDSFANKIHSPKIQLVLPTKKLIKAFWKQINRYNNENYEKVLGIKPRPTKRWICRYILHIVQALFQLFVKVFRSPCFIFANNRAVTVKIK